MYNKMENYYQNNDDTIKKKQLSLKELENINVFLK